jgi:hypothetical protein
VIGRHTHRSTPPPPRPEPTPTGIDYLGLVEAAHEAETTGRISFAHMPSFEIPAHEEDR